MKKLLMICVLIGLLFSVAEAKKAKIFDLKDQYFSGTMLKKRQKGFGLEQRYDVGKVFVITDTKFNGYSYMFGLFTVDIKEPLEEWSVNIKKKNGTHSGLTTIRLTSDTGKSYYITYCSQCCYSENIPLGYMQVNSKVFKIKKDQLMSEKLTSSITNSGGKTSFSVNGSVLLKIEQKDFGNLEKVEVELNDNHSDDELLALDIYRIK